MSRNLFIKAFRHLSRRAADRGESSPDAEDSLQEAFLRIWQKRIVPADLRHAEGLLAVTARNVAIDSMRRCRPTSSIDDVATAPQLSEDPPDDSTEETLQQVESLMNRLLSERDREMLYHRDHDEWEYSELSEYYGLSEPNIRMILSRCRKKIREAYRENSCKNSK